MSSTETLNDSSRFSLRSVSRHFGFHPVNA
jgi:hypothetical protein